MTNKPSFTPKHYSGATKRRNSPKPYKGSLIKFIPPINNWGYFTIGFLVGVLLTTITIFSFYPKKPATAPAPTAFAHNTKNTVKAATQEDPPKEVATTVAVQSIKEPRFDFYTELAGDSHENDKHKTHGSPSLDLKSAPKPINKYLVQAGSFKRRADADALKARLALNGLTAKIELVKLNEEEYWHRVLLGPFQSEAQATEQKQLLKTLEVDSILVLNSKENT